MASAIPGIIVFGSIRRCLWPEYRRKIEMYSDLDLAAVFEEKKLGSIFFGEIETDGAVASD
jgi:predicted nucleotidyltransferase